MTPKAPPTRRKFTDAWDEIDYLYAKLLYWFYEREDRHEALRFGRRLEKLLKTAPETIRAEECRSLLAELKGNLPAAIRHRDNEIRLIKRLLEASRAHGGLEYVKRHGYDYGDLSDRLDLAAMLYHEAGDVEQAIRLLEESRDLCREHGLTFDGNGLLREYCKEQRAREAQPSVLSRAL